MALRGKTPAHVASRAGLHIVDVDEPELVRLTGLVLEIGPGASDAAVIECAYRHFLGLRGPVDEAELARCVASHFQTHARTRDSGLMPRIAVNA
jgi:hypothetical protein